MRNCGFSGWMAGMVLPNEIAQQRRPRVEALNFGKP
jgi:hypothetical protein